MLIPEYQRGLPWPEDDRGYLENGRGGFDFILRYGEEGVDSHTSDFRGFIAVARERFVGHSEIGFVINEIQGDPNIEISGYIKYNQEIIEFHDVIVEFLENLENDPDLQTVYPITLDLKTSTISGDDSFMRRLPPVEFDRNANVKSASKRH